MRVLLQLHFWCLEKKTSAAVVGVNSKHPGRTIFNATPLVVLRKENLHCGWGADSDCFGFSPPRTLTPKKIGALFSPPFHTEASHFRDAKSLPAPLPRGGLTPLGR